VSDVFTAVGRAAWARYGDEAGAPLGMYWYSTIRPVRSSYTRHTWLPGNEGRHDVGAASAVVVAGALCVTRTADARVTGASGAADGDADAVVEEAEWGSGDSWAGATELGGSDVGDGTAGASGGAADGVLGTGGDARSGTRPG
jgi:hypothetical protein